MKRLLTLLLLLTSFTVVAQEADFDYEEIEKPTFKGGGLDHFRAWVANRISVSADKMVEGTLRLSFVVGKTGKIEDITVVEGVDPAIDEYVTKVLKYAPKWKPGMKDGQPVRVKYNLPLVFRSPSDTPHQSDSDGSYANYGKQVWHQEQPIGSHIPEAHNNTGLSTMRGGLGHR